MQRFEKQNGSSFDIMLFLSESVEYLDNDEVACDYATSCWKVSSNFSRPDMEGILRDEKCDPVIRIRKKF